VQNGEMTSGTLISFVTYTFIIGGAIAGLGSLTTELLGAMGATERVREILDLSPELSLSDKKPKKEITGDIKFVDVDFSYPSRKDLQILKKINLDISKGEKVALVGPSGVGKSTIIQLLLKFYHIDSGQILLDELPIQEYELRGLRQNIALVPQEVILFGGSILENIKYGDQNATEDEIIEAAKQANAWSFISNFPEGLNTLIGERGIKLSGGQRQRIAIARAILKNPKILLLDEATSALDTESEKLVQDALNNLMKNRTSIIIAHRLSTITDVDRIYVFQEGRIVEQGNHQTLMQNPEGVYYKQAQMGRLFD
ncbi:MAG: ATP-binding cassette domain-containing protein, partial [Bacteroidia bacterium]|nr:ATP-binding cassette domain-containing protein [Bacteroidia bacterium]